MKTRLTLIAMLLLVGASLHSMAQMDNASNGVWTAAPYLSITPDARAGAMGNCAAASSPDVYSMYHNPAKYAFLEDRWTIGMGCVPRTQYSLEPNKSLAHLALAYKINDRFAIAATARDFICGDLVVTQVVPQYLHYFYASLNDFTASSKDYAFDIAGAARIGDYLSLGVAGRLIFFNLKSNAGFEDASHALAFDVSGYYQRSLCDWADLSLGASVTNIGSKMTYYAFYDNAFAECIGDDTILVFKNYLPTTLRFGVAAHFDLQPKHTLAVHTELWKQLVPPDEDDANVFQGMARSFEDPVVDFGMGVEYWYNHLVAARLGYINGKLNRGTTFDVWRTRNDYITVGAGLRYKGVGLDASFMYRFDNGFAFEADYIYKIDLSFGLQGW